MIDLTKSEKYIHLESLGMGPCVMKKLKVCPRCGQIVGRELSSVLPAKKYYPVEHCSIPTKECTSTVRSAELFWQRIRSIARIAEESSQKYDIIKVAWMSQYGSNYITNTSEAAAAGTKYTVYVVLEVATPNHYFMTGEGRVSAVPSVTVNGNNAWANNAMDYSLFMVNASKYEHDTTYQKYLTVMYTFPTVEAAPIESIEFGVPELVPGERVPTTWQASGVSIDAINGNANNGQIGVTKVEWILQDGTPLAEMFIR